jgi:hypothetical protein
VSVLVKGDIVSFLKSGLFSNFESLRKLKGGFKIMLKVHRPCPNQGLFNHAIFMQISSGETVPLTSPP